MDRIPLVQASLGEQELAAVRQVFSSNWQAGQGPRGKALEAELAERYGVGGAVAVSNCGAALHLALLAFGVQPGDEVIVADYTFPAPAHAVRYVGAVPVFADVRGDTGTVDPLAVADLVGPRTVGVIAVDTVGLPADYAELKSITDRNGLFLIEDAACAVGATYQGRQAGALAPVGCLSFHGRKGITSGEGGALLTADPALTAVARLRSSFGIESIFDQAQVVGLPIPVFTEIGYNYKLSDIAAAILQVQIGRIDELLDRRRAVAARYAELLADEELVMLPYVPPDRTHAWQSYLVKLDASVDRAGVAADLRAQGIGCGHGTWACHLQPVYETKQQCPVSAELFQRQLAIPMHAELTMSQVERVAESLRVALRTHAHPQRPPVRGRSVENQVPERADDQLGRRAAVTSLVESTDHPVPSGNRGHRPTSRPGRYGMNSRPPTPERILQLLNGYWATGILGAAASHSLFTHLEAGADTADQLAAKAGISERGAQTLLDGLVGLGLVELRDGSYRNTAEATSFLVEGQPACLSDFAELKLAEMRRLVVLPDVVRNGGPITEAAVEVADNPHWELLVPAIAAQSVPVAMAAADMLRLEELGELSILDVGGGSGIYSAIWLGLNPAARSTQIDWAPVNAIARRLVAERGVADRFTCIDGDFHTTDFGTAAYDIVVYSHVAHQEGPEGNVAIFAKLRGALRPGGTLVICDYIVDDDRSGPAFPLIFASEMLLKSTQGGTWRRADYQTWLVKAGFEEISFQPTPSSSTLVFAR